MDRDRLGPQRAAGGHMKAHFSSIRFLIVSVLVGACSASPDDTATGGQAMSGPAAYDPRRVHVVD